MNDTVENKYKDYIYPHNIIREQWDIARREHLTVSMNDFNIVSEEMIKQAEQHEQGRIKALIEGKLLLHTSQYEYRGDTFADGYEECKEDILSSLSGEELQK